MTNSVKKRTYAHYCCGTNAVWKRDVNRAFRRINKIRVQKGLEPKVFDEVAQLWSSPLDGIAAWYGPVRKRQLLTRCGGHRRIRCFVPDEWSPKVYRK